MDIIARNDNRSVYDALFHDPVVGSNELNIPCRDAVTVCGMKLYGRIIFLEQKLDNKISRPSVFMDNSKLQLFYDCMETRYATRRSGEHRVIGLQFPEFCDTSS